MESQVVRRRINTISAHFAAGILTEDVTSPNTHLFPLNCSSNVNTSFRRLDSRMQFGRQASASQGYFMRPAITSSLEQRNQASKPELCSAKIANETKTTTTPEPPSYSRPASVEPLFSRPVREELDRSNISTTEFFKRDKLAASDYHKSVTPQEKQITCTRQAYSSRINGNGWLPRINVIESRCNHVITVELPGVDINDVRVEMDDKNLIVRGRRSMKWLKAAGCSNDSVATYHRREIAQGPYQIIWPLPPGTNKNSVSAELVEGILHVTIPKL